MSKRKAERANARFTANAGMSATTPGDATGHAPARAEMFSFDDPIPVMERAEILDYVQAWSNGKWYEPPVSWPGLSKSFRAGVHHASAIYFKRNVLSSTFKPHPLLSRAEFDKLALDYLVFGNGYMEPRKNMLGATMAFKRAPAKYVRRTIDLKSFVQISAANQVEYAFPELYHMMEPDINQEVYGLPEYLGALNSAWLNESATLFRRKYHERGGSSGYIFYMSDAAQSQDDIDRLRDAFKSGKGIGAWKNLFMYAPGGDKDSIKLIPLSEASAKDEFFNIKNVTRDDLLAAHRIPPNLIGIVPAQGTSGGMGAADTATAVFATNEIEPLQRRFMALNDYAGEEIVSFETYRIIPSQGVTGSGK